MGVKCGRMWCRHDCCLWGFGRRQSVKVIGVGRGTWDVGRGTWDVGRGTKRRKAAVTAQGRGRKDLTLAESHPADSVWM
jgi:hypothetical protein